jgi:ankyrin repeat protein
VSIALFELAPKCELTMHEVASELADVLRMSVLDSSSAPAGDLPPATQRWSRLRVLITAASAFAEAAAKRALCLICLEEVNTLRGLVCPVGHLICSACLQRYICSLAGSAKLRSSNGALDCLGAHQQSFSFSRSMVEPHLFGDALRLYLETMETPETSETPETTETPGEGEVQCTPESIQPELHEALNLSCPSCGVFCDPDPDGCIAMTCSSCHVAFCWLCFQACGHDAHPHCREEHGGFFPSKHDLYQWHRRLRWHKVDRVFQRSFQGRPPDRKVALREEALNLCERNLADSEIGLWPFPSVQPSVGGAIGVVPHVQFAMFGQIDELRALLDETPELIDQPNDRGLTCLMAAAHGGYAAVVAVLLERGADVARRDARGVSALDYAVREHRQEALLTLLKHSESRSLQLVNAVDPEGNTLLMVAAERSHKDLIPILLEAKADPNMATSANTPHHLTTRGGVTALMIAAHHGYEQIAHILLEAGAIVDTQLPDRPDTQLPDGRTALMIAAKLGRERCAHVLLKAKADPNKATSDGVTALMLAAQHGHEPCIRDLLEAGAIVNAPNFVAVYGDGHEPFVRILLEAQADPNKARSDGTTALMLAAQHGHEPCVRDLLEAGAVVNAPNFAAVTALILAAEKGHEPCVHVLLEAKADPNKAKSNGATALILAAESGHPCVRVLLEAKADPNKARSDGWTALMIAARNSHVRCVRVLLEAQADPNKARSDGWTALMAAAQHGHEPCAHVLLEAKADPNKAKSDGATALILAAESGRPCVRVLLEAKANPNKARSDGWTALMIAAQDGHEPCVHVLLESKADPNQMNCAGRTASMIASERGHERCARVLLEAYFNPYQAKGGGGGRAGGKGGGTVRSTRCVAPYHEVTRVASAPTMPPQAVAHHQPKVASEPLALLFHDEAWLTSWIGAGKGGTICTFFARNGQCRYGDRCRFIHDRGGAASG